MNKYIKGILIGLCLGDGHINKKDNCLQITHSKKQLFYLEYINNLLSNIFNVQKHNMYHRLDSKYDEYTLVFGGRIFKTIRKMLYKNNVKYFSKKNFTLFNSTSNCFMDNG